MTAVNQAQLTPAYPPFRMKAQAAAYYCGMSLSAFMREVADGNLAEGRKTAGGRYWLRSTLEDYMLGRSAVEHDFSGGI